MQQEVWRFRQRLRTLGPLCADCVPIVCRLCADCGPPERRGGYLRGILLGEWLVQ